MKYGEENMKKKEHHEDVTVYGTVKVSDKGQIALPSELRKEIGINRGDQLLVVRRKDSPGFIIMTMDEVWESVWSIHGDVFKGR